MKCTLLRRCMHSIGNRRHHHCFCKKEALLVGEGKRNRALESNNKEQGNMQRFLEFNVTTSGLIIDTESNRNLLALNHRIILNHLPNLLSALTRDIRQLGCWPWLRQQLPPAFRFGCRAVTDMYNTAPKKQTFWRPAQPPCQILIQNCFSGSTDPAGHAHSAAMLALLRESPLPHQTPASMKHFKREDSNVPYSSCDPD